MGTGCSEPRLLGSRRMHIVAIATMAAGLLALGAGRAAAARLKQFNLPTGATATSLIDGPGKALWFGEDTAANKPALGRITTSGKITFKRVSSTGDVGDVAVGAGGAVWFTLTDTAHAIGVRRPSGKIKLITPGMDGLNNNAAPVELAKGKRGTVWFLDHGTTNAIGKITASGAIVEYPTPGNDPPDDLTVARDGRAWFTVFDMPGGVGVAPKNAPAGTPATVFPTGSGTMPAGITAGDGKIWFSDQGTPSAIGRVTPNGTIKEFGMANGLQMNADPDALTAVPGGNIWFDDQYANNPAVGKITPTGKITEFPLAHEAWDITVGSDGNVWLATGDNGGAHPGIARVMRKTGKINFFSAGLKPGAVVGDGTNIVSGPDGNLWFLDIGKPYAIVRARVR